MHVRTTDPVPDELRRRVRLLFEHVWEQQAGTAPEVGPGNRETLLAWCERTGNAELLDETFALAEVTQPANVRAWREDVLGESLPPGWAPAADEWERLGCEVTFADLHPYIADRTPRDRFEPVAIGGSVCAAAGVYFGVASLTSRLNSSARVGPQTPLRCVLSNMQISLLWGRLTWRVGPPPPLQFPRIWLTGFVLAVVGWGGWFGLLAFGGAGPGAWALHIAAWVGTVTFTFAANRENPLPNGIYTFRDLAERLAAGERERA